MAEPAQHADSVAACTHCGAPSHPPLSMCGGDEPNADSVAKLVAALAEYHAKCKITLWQHDESGYGFFKGQDAVPVDLHHLATFCVGVLLARSSASEDLGDGGVGEPSGVGDGSQC